MRKLAAVVVLATSVASADPAVDPEAKRVGEEANLESRDSRRGFVGGVYLGPSYTTGSTTATGGSFVVRLGQVANPSTVIQFELGGATNFKRKGEEGRLLRDTLMAFVAGFQRWLTPSLSLRFGAGVGAYNCNECGATGMSFTRAGIVGSFGVALDLIRFKGLVVSLEASTTNQLNREGLFSTNALDLGLSFD